MERSIEELAEKKLQREKLQFILLGIVLVIGIGIQFEAIYANYTFDKIVNQNEGLMHLCFYSPYQYRWITDILSMTGIFTSLILVSRNGWKLPEKIWRRILIFSPLILQMVDQFLVRVIFY